MKYYISDLHLRHKNIIKFDNRPFGSTEEMEDAIVSNWNNTIKKGDVVYILGDFIWSGALEVWNEILDKLNGTKFLIRGNHDSDKIAHKCARLRKDFFVSDYKEIDDGDYKLILSHYPLMSYNGGFRERNFHFYGHVHITAERDAVNNYYESLWYAADHFPNTHVSLGQAINVGCMMPYMGYTPRSCEQIVTEWRKCRQNGKYE